MRKRYEYYEKLNKMEHSKKEENEFIFDLFFLGSWIRNGDVKLCTENYPIASYGLMGEKIEFYLKNFDISNKSVSFAVPSNIKNLIRYNRKARLEKKPEKHFIFKIPNNVDRTIFLLVL
jgi:hypothetical protein